MKAIYYISGGPGSLGLETNASPNKQPMSTYDKGEFVWLGLFSNMS